MVDFDPRFEIMPGTRLHQTFASVADDLYATVGAAIPE
jgi:hypothetical protein